MGDRIQKTTRERKKRKKEWKFHRFNTTTRKKNPGFEQTPRSTLRWKGTSIQSTKKIRNMIGSQKIGRGKKMSMKGNTFSWKAV